MKALLVWQEIPENVKWYVIDDPSEADLEMLAKVHGHFLGTDIPESAEEALDRVSALLADPQYGNEGFSPEEAVVIGQWRGLGVDESDLPNIGSIDKVFTCGFML